MKWLTKCLVGAAAVSMSVASAANAQVRVIGSATGCFYGAFNMTTTCTASNLDVLGGLTYFGSTFNGGTEPFGVASFGGNPEVLPALNVNNFGSFNTQANGFVYGDPNQAPTNFFRLVLTFTSPETGQTVYGGGVTGAVITLADGSLTVDFDNSRQIVPGTSMTVKVNDVDINPGADLQAVSGNVTVSPEPASMTLLATGLVGIFGAARRRRKNIAA